jgi:hypothetical protein
MATLLRHHRIVHDDLRPLLPVARDLLGGAPEGGVVGAALASDNIPAANPWAFGRASWALNSRLARLLAPHR